MILRYNNNSKFEIQLIKKAKKIKIILQTINYNINHGQEVN